jgi:hypothetical protein
VAALALFVGVTTANAGTVSWFGSCYQNGADTTTPGPLQLKLGWFTTRLGQLQQFLGGRELTASDQS